MYREQKRGMLGLHRYRFRDFRKVEGWAQACLVSFGYLEWYRSQQRARQDLSEKERTWWEWQGSNGVSRPASRPERTGAARSAIGRWCSRSTERPWERRDNRWNNDDVAN
jgi:hypothetical protein